MTCEGLAKPIAGPAQGVIRFERASPMTVPASEHVKVSREGPVLAIVLDRPERRNAITVAMYAALAEAVRSAAGDPAIRLITIRGQGADFTAGNDLMDFLQEARPEAIDELPVGQFLVA